MPVAFWCVGSTPGEKPINPGDLSDEDVFFSDFCVARINAGSETLLIAVGMSLILRVALGLGSRTEVGVKMGSDQEGKEK